MNIPVVGRSGQLATQFAKLRRSHRRAKDARQKGFALLLTIWILALLSVIAVGMASETQSESRMARNRLELAHARALAEAGVSMAMLGLIIPDVNARWRADGSTHTLRYDGGTIAVTVQDEAGKIDLNATPIEVLGGLFGEFDLMEKEDRDSVLKEIADRRALVASDTSQPAIPVVNRSITDAPRAVSKVAFATVSELRQLNGMTRALYDLIYPFVTVYSQRGTINPLTAPREVLVALPDIGEDAIDFYIAARSSPGANQTLPPIGITAAKYLATTDVNAVTITARAETAHGVAFSREAIVTLSAATRPTILAWRPSFESDQSPK